MLTVSQKIRELAYGRGVEYYNWLRTEKCKVQVVSIIQDSYLIIGFKGSDRVITVSGGFESILAIFSKIEKRGEFNFEDLAIMDIVQTVCITSVFSEE